MASQTPKLNTGFTFIEILIVVSLIAVLTTTGIVSYQKFSESRKFNQAKDELRTHIRMIASRAQNNEKDCDSCGGCGHGSSPLDGWNISFATNSYTIQGKCDTASFGQKTVNVDYEITTSGVVEITFYPFGHLSGTTTDLVSGLTISFDADPVLLIEPTGHVSDL